jgi:hypothetical protein
MSKPRNCRDLTKRQVDDLAKLLQLEELSEKQRTTLKILSDKKQRSLDPGLSQVAYGYLIRRYGFEKYNKRIASTVFGKSTCIKGNELEDESIKVISSLDKVKYEKCCEVVRNDYIFGICDIISPLKDKIIDVKTSWNINTFLPYLSGTLDRSYWFQMQGYLELYNIEVGEVCFVLLNTPPYLVERERAKYTEKYIFGEISRERYDEEISKIELAFNYNKIPLKRKVIRFQVNRCRELMPLLYKKVDKCRTWLNEFEEIHLASKRSITTSEFYINPPQDEPLIDA